MFLAVGRLCSSVLGVDCFHSHHFYNIPFPFIQKKKTKKVDEENENKIGSSIKQKSHEEIESKWVYFINKLAPSFLSHP